MSKWASQRKRNYTIGFIVAAVIVIGIPAFLLLYKAPTCSDGVQNEGEQGIDCGGPCRTLCQGNFLPPVVTWADSEKVAPGIYNLAAYVQNPNINDTAVNVPYQFSMYDGQGILITQVNGTMTIPPDRNTLAFVSGVNVGQRQPVKGGTQFVFRTRPTWQPSSDTLSDISISNKQYSEDANSASLQATIANNGVAPVTNLTVYAILSDVNGNELAFSKTVISNLAAGASQTIPFTWSQSFNGAVVSEELLPVITPSSN